LDCPKSDSAGRVYDSRGIALGCALGQFECNGYRLASDFGAQLGSRACGAAGRRDRDDSVDDQARRLGARDSRHHLDGDCYLMAESKRTTDRHRLDDAAARALFALAYAPVEHIGLLYEQDGQILATPTRSQRNES